MFTNLNNGGTYTNVFAANSREHKIVDNGDGTITIFVQGSGVDRLYDSKGRLVLVDSGNFRFAIDINFNGTPGDANDDEEVPDSFLTSVTPPAATTSLTATSARTCSSSRPSRPWNEPTWAAYMIDGRARR